MHLRTALLSASLAALACGGPSSTPAPQAETKPEKAEPAKATGFAFEPTIRQNVPDGVMLQILLEVGNASEATLDVVVATAAADRDPPVRIELWTFDQRDKAKLEPKGEPVWLLPLTADEKVDGREELARLRRALSLPNSFKTRPSGLDAPSAAAALQQLGAAAKALADGSAATEARLEAARTTFLGLDDDVAFDATLFPKILTAADTLAEATVDAPSSRRATATVTTAEGPLKLELLKKPGGWSITKVE